MNAVAPPSERIRAYLDGTLALTNATLLRFAGLTPERARQLDLIGLLNHFRTGIFDEPEIAVRRVLQTGIDYAGELDFDRHAALRSHDRRRRHRCPARYRAAGAV